jgi:hypothetical protein
VIDTIKALFTYFTALTIVVGGGLILYLTRGEANAQNLQLIVSGFMGAALQFLFNRETQTQTARQSAAATAAATPTLTATAGPPASVTATPSAPAATGEFTGGAP